MNVTRRGFCASTVGAAAVAATGAVGTARAQAELDVSGTITSEVNADPTGTRVELFLSSDPLQRMRATIGSDGGFSGTIPEAGTYQVVYFNEGGDGLIEEPDDLPLVYFLTEIPIEEGGDLGEFTLPEGLLASIQCVDADGNPIENLPINFRAANGSGVSPGAFTTTPNGYVKFVGASQTGVELAGETSIEVQPPSRDGGGDRLREINVTEQFELRLTVPDPTRYPDVTVNDGDGATATPTATTPESGSQGDATTPTPASDTQPDSTTATATSGRTRGFFSNSAAGEGEPGFLSNAVNLTTIGFLMSVAGIAYQMVGGR